VAASRLGVQIGVVGANPLYLQTPAMFKRNVFGHSLFLRKLVIRLFGSLVYTRFNIIHRNEVRGAERLTQLPDKNVLIVSNHQTYFADVSFFYLAIYAALAGFPNQMRFPGFLFPRKTNLFYVAAEETMKDGFIPRLLALTGAVTVNRSWRAKGENVRRKVDREEVKNIDKALECGWVITFPQGTTTPYAPGRFGTAVLIKQHRPVVVPVVIDGFRRAFDKKGLAIKKPKSVLRMTVKAPLQIDYDGKVEDIMLQLMNAIEQSPEFDTIDQKKKQEAV